MLSSRLNHRFARLVAGATAMVIVTFLPTGVARARQAPPAPLPAAGAQAAVSDPADALGPGWHDSSDVLVTGVGDTGGFHVFLAREKDAFAWSTLATLGASLGELGPLTGYTCLTGSGHYVAAVYAPAMAVNKPTLLQAGGIAAIIDVRTGRVRQVADRVQLAYFDPSCGTGDRVLLTRSLNGDQRANEQTDLLTVDAASATVVGTRRIDAQLTLPVPATGGDYGIARGGLVRVADSGALTPVTTPDGVPFAVRGTGSGAIDLLSVKNDRAVAQRYEGGKLTRLGDGPRRSLQLFSLIGGRDVLVGDVGSVHVGGAADLSTVNSGRTVDAVSAQGHLMVLETLTKQNYRSIANRGAPAQPGDAGALHVTVRATRSGRVSTGLVETPTNSGGTAKGQPAPLAGAGVRPNDTPPADVRQPVCAVPRNDIHRQVLQPSPNMVEWAVDLAVQGQLKVARPAGYLKTGEPAYTPQGMFPAPTGVRVPAQVLLGILAQESNVAQASWHAVPGDAGNPLIADYYGNANSDLELISYGDADCGYGVAQVTDGMRLADTGVSRTAAQQVAISSDYAANIAAALQILAKKWTDLKGTDNTYVNDGDPRYVENWFLAVWGYNSGVYLPSGGGPYGVGWLNNPANPAYPANRAPFLRTTYGDASHPADWPYEEKVMGWIEAPQLSASAPAGDYAQPLYGATHAANQWLALPELPDMLFCGGAGQACDPGNVGDPCPSTNSSCWWHGNIGWALCSSDCATESITFASNLTEPPIQRTYPTDCTPLVAPSGHTLTVVDDLTDSSVNLLTCAKQPPGGKFTLRLGEPTGDGGGMTPDGVPTWSYLYSYYAEIDLHQLGAGYLGHTWFTHTYPPGQNPSVENYHKVVGTWTPDLPRTGRYDVIAHLPSHGGAADASYVIFTSATDVSGSQGCPVSQDTSGVDRWVYLGRFQLSAGAKVELDNIQYPADGSADIAYDAVAFQSEPAGTTHSCGASYP